VIFHGKIGTYQEDGKGLGALLTTKRQRLTQQESTCTAPPRAPNSTTSKGDHCSLSLGFNSTDPSRLTDAQVAVWAAITASRSGLSP
jgi:hypothetical protein